MSRATEAAPPAPATPRIRPEEPADPGAIRALHQAAFPTPDEARLDDALAPRDGSRSRSSPSQGSASSDTSPGAP